jgi:uncharacterized protein (TIGR03083 family)
MASSQDQSKLDYLDLLAAEGSALISAVRHGPLTATVPTCPGWDVRALSAHIGTTWNWAAHVVRERLQEPPAYDMPSDLADDAVQPYLENALETLLEALGNCPPDTEVWGFGPKPRTAAFWRRRQAMETVVHRVDAELAVGEPPRVQPAVAADGIREFVDVTIPRMHYKKDPPPGQLRITATDTGEVWTCGDPAGGEGTLSGRAEDLYLMLWRRTDGRAVEAGGDPEILAGWRALGCP